jgi:hypothetical protein
VAGENAVAEALDGEGAFQRALDEDVAAVDVVAAAGKSRASAASATAFRGAAALT